MGVERIRSSVSDTSGRARFRFSLHVQSFARVCATFCTGLCKRLHGFCIGFALFLHVFALFPWFCQFFRIYLQRILHYVAQTVQSFACPLRKSCAIVCLTYSLIFTIMAKGNLFLGTGRRSVGDVVLYRRNGEQVSRVRVRKIANPKSDGQALQRAYMAAVSKFYSFFKSPLEKSWQGLNRSQSQSAFLKANAKLVRAEGYYVPKGFGLAPLPLQVSKGTLPRVGGTTDSQGTFALPSRFSGLLVDDTGTTLGSVSNAFINAGYSAGDQVTLVVILYDDDLGYFPRWGRFVLDPNSIDTLDGLFASCGINEEFTTNPTSLSRIAWNGSVGDIAAMAVIVSRYSNGEWQRSTEIMSASEPFISDFIGDEARAAAIASYQGAVAVPESDVYLNGSTTESTEPVPTGVADFTIGMFSSNDLTSAGVVSGSYTPTKVGYRTYNDVRMLNVTATNNANGKSVSRLVLNRIAGNADLGKVYTYAGAAATAPAGVASAWPIMSATDPLVAWLAANGITLTIPTE